MTTTYAAATTLDEALAAVGGRPADRRRHRPGRRCTQGKTPLPDALVAIHELEELRGIAEQAGGGLRIGALASHTDLVEHPLVRERFTALADASAIVGSHATRHVGTIGGNVMNASPAMETGGPLMCFAAAAVLVSAGGERRLPLEELLTGPGPYGRPARRAARRHRAARPAGGERQLLRPSGVPPADGDRRGRRTCAVTLGRVAGHRGARRDHGAGATILRVPAAEAALVGSDGGAAAVRAAGDAAAAAASPISDVRASSDYRLAMAAVIARRTVATAIARARAAATVPIPASPALHGAAD